MSCWFACATAAASPELRAVWAAAIRRVSSASASLTRGLEGFATTCFRGGADCARAYPAMEVSPSPRRTQRQKSVGREDFRRHTCFRLSKFTGDTIPNRSRGKTKRRGLDFQAPPFYGCQLWELKGLEAEPQGVLKLSAWLNRIGLSPTILCEILAARLAGHHIIRWTACCRSAL